MSTIQPHKNTLARIFAILLFIFGFLIIILNSTLSISTVIGILFIVIYCILTIRLYSKKMLRQSENYLPIEADKIIYPFEILEHISKLDLTDTEGKLAKYTKIQTLKILKDNLTGYTTRSLAADGYITNINTGKFTTYFEKELADGRLQLQTIFNNPPKKDEIIERKLSCDFNDSFTNNKEYFTHFIIFPVSKFQMSVVFPIARPPLEAWVEIKDKSGKTIPSNPKNCKIYKGDSNVRDNIIYNISKPDINFEYTVFWKW